MDTIEDIQKDDNLRQSLFPVTREGIYLGHAGVCPLPSRVVNSINAYSQRCTLQDQEDCFDPEWIWATRQMVADLCGVSRDEIALVGPTSSALSMIASGISFQPGDNVIIYFEDYPSNVYPWMALREKGVEIRFLKVDQLGVIEPHHVESLIDDRTRLVALASCHFLSGYRIDVNAIGKILRERNILFSLDMIQTMGAFETPLKWVDFAAADSHKWLLGPCAAGVMYVRKEIQSSFNPPVHGWHNIKCPDFVAQEELSFRNDARKYEAGSPNFLGLAGLHTCFEMIKELGLENISKALSDHRSYIVAELQKREISPLCSGSGASKSGGMTSFTKTDLDLPMIHKRLAQDKITVSLRRDRNQTQYLRLSPHYYNNRRDLDVFFSKLDEFL